MQYMEQLGDIRRPVPMYPVPVPTFDNDEQFDLEIVHHNREQS